jgi:hypothetical protein
VLPPGRANVSTKPAPTRIGDANEHNRQVARDPLQRCHTQAANGQNNVRRKSDQFRSVFAMKVCIAGTPAMLDLQVATECPAPFLKPTE